MEVERVQGVGRRMVSYREEAETKERGRRK